MTPEGDMTPRGGSFHEAYRQAMALKHPGASLDPLEEEREFFIDNLLVRIHLIIEMV